MVLQYHVLSRCCATNRRSESTWEEFRQPKITATRKLPSPPQALVDLYAASRNWVGRSAVIFICMKLYGRRTVPRTMDYPAGRSTAAHQQLFCKPDSGLPSGNGRLSCRENDGARFGSVRCCREDFGFLWGHGMITHDERSFRATPSMAWYLGIYHTTVGSIAVLYDSAPSVSTTSPTACYLLLLYAILATWSPRRTSEWFCCCASLPRLSARRGCESRCCTQNKMLSNIRRSF